MSFIYERKINYYETDKMGVVHHSNYIRYLEEARSEWLESLEIPMSKLEELGYTIPALEVNCKYKNHITSGDIITIKPKIAEYNGVRMKVDYEVIEKNTQKTVIQASTMHCFTDKTLKPINMKKHNEKINRIFEDLLEEE